MGISRTTWSAFAFALLAWASPLLAESVWVQSDNVNIRAGKGPIHPVVANVRKGTELQVLSRDGQWVQVQAPGAAPGWVFDTALSPRRVNADAFSNLNREAAGVNTAAASRGLTPNAEQYAVSKGMSKAPLERLIAIKNRIPPAEGEAFNRSVQAAAGRPTTPAPAPAPVPQYPPAGAPAPPPPAAPPPAAQPPAVQPPRPPAYTPQPQPVYTPQAPAQRPPAAPR
jgi:uncharacterized protein YraI